MARNPELNTHVRLFDLVRFMRGELHQADLITDEEYAWLCMEAPLAKGGGSPSPRRLEDYDDIRANMAALRNGLVALTRSTDYTADQLRAAAASILNR
jgi:hypothetical protein